MKKKKNHVSFKKKNRKKKQFMESNKYLCSRTSKVKTKSSNTILKILNYTKVLNL